MWHYVAGLVVPNISHLGREDEGTTIFWNNVNYLPRGIASHTKKLVHLGALHYVWSPQTWAVELNP